MPRRFLALDLETTGTDPAKRIKECDADHLRLRAKELGLELRRVA